MWGFPDYWVIGRPISKAIDAAVDWMVVNWDPLFSAINIVLLRVLVAFERVLLWLPWWVVVLIAAFLAWRFVGVRFALMAAGLLGGICVFGLYVHAVATLSLTLVAALICVVIGLPLGILAAKSDRFDAGIRPLLDGMQTMPSFVYLIPAVMLFGLGKVPGLLATFIYAIPPIIRLTNLGIRHVDPQAVEAGLAFGSSPWQLLVKVQMRLALPTIMAGLNQTVMMALAMVVIASMIGARGLGMEVLTGINRLEVGRGFLGGISIVLMAIILDRVSQGITKGRIPGARQSEV